MRSTNFTAAYECIVLSPAMHTLKRGARYGYCNKGKGNPYSTTERKVPELIPVLGSQPAL